MKCLRFLVKLLLVIGALNWGLVGFFDYNLVADIFGADGSMGSRIVFAIVGLAGLVGIAGLFCKGCACKSGGSCCNKGGSCSNKDGK
jgi:uncharacterized membrane protein YuzA (DUF378 family)